MVGATQFHLPRPWPDEGHEDIGRYIDDTTVSVEDLSMGMSALAQLAGTFFAALDSSVSDRDQLNRRVASLEAQTSSLLTRMTNNESKDSAQDTRLAALETLRLRGTTATGAVSSLLAAGTRDITVSLKSPMPSTSYLPLAFIDPATGINLSTVSVAVLSKTTTTVTVRVTNSGLGLLQTVNFTVLALDLS